MKIDLLDDTNDSVRVPKIWEWVQAEPTLHMTDDSPSTLEEFQEYLKFHRHCGIKFFCVHEGDDLVGMVGARHIDHKHAMFAGIVFAPEVRGTGLAAKVVSKIVLGLKYREVFARFFEHNKRVEKFLLKLGFRPATLDLVGLPEEVLQKGEPVRFRTLAFHKE